MWLFRSDSAPKSGQRDVPDPFLSKLHQRSQIINSLKFLLPINLLLFACIYYFYSQISRRSPQPDSILQNQKLIDKAAFIQDVVGSEIDGPHNNAPLTALCTQGTWIEGLIFKCAAAIGGVGNVRNIFLNCVRYAIEAGATAIILPEMAARGDDMMAIKDGDKHLPFGYLFDVNYFSQALKTSCPRIRIITSLEDIDGRTTSNYTHLEPKTLAASLARDYFPICINPSGWATNFHSFLAGFTPSVSAQNPRVIDLEVHYFEWPLSFDSPAFVATFGRIIQFTSDIKTVAAAILYGIATKYAPSITPSAGIQNGTFYGAHLRTAKDATLSGWRTYDEQSSDYLTEASSHNLSLIYLSSGNPNDTSRFIQTALTKNITVMTKEQILALPGFETEKQAMDAMSWDQKAMLDYEIMLRASIFGGTFETSFGWNIALKRHIVVGGGTWVAGSDRPEAEGGVKFDDGRSKMFGRKGKMDFFPRTLWP